jgi:YD repeat-containing protein
MLLRLVSVAALGLLAPASAFASFVPPQTAPISIGMSPASPRSGSEVRLTGGAGASNWLWDLDGDGAFDDASGKEVVASFPAGVVTVRASAVTAVGVVTDSRTFTVHGWNVPPGGVVAATPYTARVGSPIAVKASGSDPDGLSVVTALDLDGDGSFETAGATGVATFPSPGSRVVRARFTDDAGASSVATTTLEVHAGNIAPTARIESPPGVPATTASAGVAAVAEPSGWTIGAVDPDGEVVRYEYDLDGDGVFETDLGSDARVPKAALDREVIAVRVTDDGGAAAVERATLGSFQVARVSPVGVPVTLSVSQYLSDATRDADGVGDFDDGTGSRISFTYASAGTYTVRVRGKWSFDHPTVLVETTSARDGADIAVPTARWSSVPPARGTAPASLFYTGSGPADVETNVDLDGDGFFADAPPRSGGVQRVFGGPTTIGVRAVDALGRAAVATAELPFVIDDLGPDATMTTTDIEAPLQASYARVSLGGAGYDADDGPPGYTAVVWDTDNDGGYDDGSPSSSAGRLPPSFGLRATDSAGVSTTLRRTVSPIDPVVSSQPRPVTSPWLRLKTQRPRLATLLRRGLTVDVSCAKPKCRTRLVVKLDVKTARKLKLRSRIVASRSVSGTHRVVVKLTPKARRALRGARSVKLTLTATATAEGAASRSSQTLTIRSASRS